eukprot:365272-Chlamydomonas_euryale.AAC.10
MTQRERERRERGKDSARARATGRVSVMMDGASGTCLELGLRAAKHTECSARLMGLYYVAARRARPLPCRRRGGATTRRPRRTSRPLIEAHAPTPSPTLRRCATAEKAAPSACGWGEGGGIGYGTSMGFFGWRREQPSRTTRCNERRIDNTSKRPRNLFPAERARSNAGLRWGKAYLARLDFGWPAPRALACREVDQAPQAAPLSTEH